MPLTEEFLENADGSLDDYECPYSNEQVDAYLRYIDIPAHFSREGGAPRDLEFLSVLKTHHLAKIPFDTLALHYSPDPKILITPSAVYHKFINKKRGGYCMEQNVLLLHMLRGLGFDAYPAGARVRPRDNDLRVGEFLGWVHMVIIVTLPEGDRYLVDVGFGGDGSTKPLPMVESIVTRNFGTQDLRLIHETVAGAMNRRQKTWTYQIRNKPEAEWASCYNFVELEFLPQDFEVMNYYTSTHPVRGMCTRVIAVKFIMDDEGREICGKVMLAGAELKRNTKGTTILEQTCETEQDRTEVLEKHFGFYLDAEEKQGILGRKTAL